ncbi:WUSCHEL-related homeobox 8-like [Phalaenopsis equestris]|uniref:WUSCHEL-related homeobox 8-like n=1 Tax=Phalaenopsis equestris TaxID=78828 RepID=UPI0009E24998|nr:WUSCHEL-related homeobox 8-like [Phalaenopsis equestris]
MAWETGCSSNMNDFHGRLYEEERAMGDLQGMLDGVLFMKVMTDEQIEVLRRQISIYATICEQLVAMHRAFTKTLAGNNFGTTSYNPSASAEVPKIAARQRWIPTSTQLQILENIFKQGYETPSKQKIAEITSKLAKHGHVSDVKVYNWFQNKRARSKKKQAVLLKSNAEQENEAEIESCSRKKMKMDENHENEEPELNRGEEEHASMDSAGVLCAQEQVNFYENSASLPTYSCRTHFREQKDDASY